MCFTVQNITEEKVKEKFQTNNGTFEDETLYVLENENNREQIIGCVKKMFPNAITRNIEVGYNNNLNVFYIKSMEFLIEHWDTNIKEVVKNNL